MSVIFIFALDHSDYSQNTEESSGDQRRLAVTHTSMKDHQLILMWKICKEQEEKKLSSCRFCHSRKPYTKYKRNQKYRKILKQCQRMDKAVEYEGDGDTNCIWKRYWENWRAEDTREIS